MTASPDIFVRRFGEQVLLHRRRLDLSQEQLSERAGVHRNLVGRVERADVVPTLTTMVRLADALGTKVSELMRDAGH